MTTYAYKLFQRMNRKLLYITQTAALMGCLLCTLPAFSQGRPEAPSALAHPVAQVLLVVIIGLLIAIGILANAVIGAMDIFRDRMKTMVTTGLILAASCCLQPAMAQEATTIIPAATAISGLSDTAFYLMISVIALELLVIFSLLFMLRYLAGIRRKKKPVKKRIISKQWLEKINNTKTVDAVSEAEQDMGHDFDGIRELNNPTPPWWKWGFYFSIFFAVVYLWRSHVSHTAPTQLQELAAAEEKAAAAKAEYLKNAANKIDENNVKALTDEGELAAGQKLFVSSCAACHGPDGQGGVGPNLTDDYWLHGGKINDIFRTIKYGVADKGMKSWQEDFSPKQLAQLASFIQSIHGSNPANPKAPQGEKE